MSMPAASLLTRRRLLKATGATALALAATSLPRWAGFRSGSPHPQLVRSIRVLMHTYVSIAVTGPDPVTAEHIIDGAFRTMSETAWALSRFEPEGPVGILNRTGILSDPPAALIEVLNTAFRISTISNGVFDVTVYPLLAYYQSLTRPVRMAAIDRTKVEQLRTLIDFRRLHIGEGKVWLEDPAMAITLDGIAKGYVVDSGMRYLRNHGIETAMIDAGGDIGVMAPPDSRFHWNIGIVDPLNPSRFAAMVPLRRGGLATSGNYEVFYSADRRLYHIINPHTGFSPNFYASVTVLAPTNVEADGWGVALSLLPTRQIPGILQAWPNPLRWYLISWEGNQRIYSPHFPLEPAGTGSAAHNFVINSH
ncbi:MAG: FAD:protein FMN transferase [Firmicutes bacterium]|nr:FAD:protein FMN transferase [Bacillota bacterium]